MKLYLAHPRDEWIRVAELAFEKKYKIDLINPFYDQPPGGDTVTNDIGMIQSSDGVLVVATPTLMIGAFMEMVYAKSMGKPVYFVDLKGVANHPWIRHHSNEIFFDIDSVGAYLTEVRQ